MTESHHIVTKVYDEDGECIAITSSYVPGKFEPKEGTKLYWAWLEARKKPIDKVE